MSADAFVLPSFSEGLLMAVLDAWSYRLPVLMTPQCSIPEGFDANSAICMQPEVASIIGWLNNLFSMSDTQINEMANNKRALVEHQFTWDKVAEQMLEFYHWVLGHSAKPGCVYLD